MPILLIPFKLLICYDSAIKLLEVRGVNQDSKDKDHEINGVGIVPEMKQAPNSRKEYLAHLPLHTLKAFQEARDYCLVRYSSIDEMNKDLGISGCQASC